MPDPQRLTPGDGEEWERLLARDGAWDPAGGSRQRGLAAARESSSLVIDTNAIVFAPPAAFRNNLKGIPIAYAPESGRIYVSGILTERVSVVDLATMSASYSWELATIDEQNVMQEVEDAFRPKELAWAGGLPSGRLWLVHTSGASIFCKAANIPVPAETTDIDEFICADTLAEYLDITSPVKHISGDPDGYLFIVSDYIEGCDPEQSWFPSLGERIQEYGAEAIRPYATPRRLTIAACSGGENITMHHKLSLSAGGFLQGKVRIRDVGFDPSFDWGQGVAGAIVMLMLTEDVDGNMSQGLYYVRRKFDDRSHSSVLLPAVSERGLVEHISVESDGRIYVATAPNDYTGDNVDDVDDYSGPSVSGYLLGFELDGAGNRIDVFEEPLDHHVSPTAMVHNEHTGRIALLYQRYIVSRRHFWIGHWWDLEKQLDDDGLTNGLDGRYRSWVDVHEPDGLGNAPVVARFTTGVEAHSLVAITAQPDVDTHEFAVGNAGGASVFLVPNLDTLDIPVDLSHGTPGLAPSLPLDLANAESTVATPGAPEVLADTDLDEAPPPTSASVTASTTTNPLASTLDGSGSVERIPAPRDIPSGDPRGLTAADTDLPLATRDNPTGLFEIDTDDPFEGNPTIFKTWPAQRLAAIAPRVHALDAPQVQVGTGPEYVLLSRLSDEVLFTVSRLGGSQLIVCTRSGDEIAGATYHGPSRVGYWPCGIAQSATGRHVYLLGHCDRKLRIVDAQGAIDASGDNQDIVVGQVDLPRMQRLELPDELNPKDQISDTLSEMASSSDGDYHLALLAEVGEIHLVHTDEDHAEVVFSETVLPWALGSHGKPEDEGPGRLQGAFESPGGTHTVRFWVLAKNGTEDVDGPVLWRYKVNPWSGESSREEFHLGEELNAPLMSAYSTQTVFFNNHRREVIVGDTIWKRTAPGSLSYRGRMGGDLTGFDPGYEPHEALFLNSGVRVVGAPTEHDLLLLLSKGDATSESFIWIEVDQAEYEERGHVSLPPNPKVKAACSWREVGGGLECAFTQAHEAKVYWTQFPWRIKTLYAQGSPALAPLP